MDEDDVYAQQLKEVFNSCDFDGKGYLIRNELIDLSQKLQLGDQVPALLTEVLGDEFTEGTVTFEVFREAFVNVLAKAIDTFDDTTEDDRSDWSEFEQGESTLKYSTNFKDEKSHDDDFSVFLRKSPEKTPHKLPTTRKTSTPNDPRSNKLREQYKTLRLPSKDEVVIEASGTVESLASTYTQELVAGTDAKELQKVWDDIAVGESGFLNLLQLSTVCDHIGMGKMADDEVELLFSELDTNGDGLVSFDEFFNGLFSSKNGAATDDESDEEEGLESIKSISSVKSLKELVKENGSMPVSPRGKQSSEVNKRISIDILSSLDPNNSGIVELAKVKEHFKKNKNVHGVLKELTPDADGRVRTKHLSRLFERIVSDSGDTIHKSLLYTYKQEIIYLRDQVDTSKNEVNVLKNNITKLSADNNSLIREGEEQVREKEETLKYELKNQAESYENKISLREKELMQQREAMLQKHQQQNQLLDKKLQEMKNEDLQTKKKIKEASVEILRLEENLKETINQLNLERKKCTCLEMELNNTTEYKQKVSELERERRSMKDAQNKQSLKIKDLESINKELRDRNDEYLAQLEQLSSAGYKVARSLNGSKGSDDITRNGSYLSDYLKPNIVKRHFSSTSHDDQVFSNSDMDECRLKIIEQDTVIAGLRRDLETVNRLLDENTSNLNERHRREISRVTEKHTSDMLEMKNLMTIELDTMSKHYSKEKENLVTAFERKMNTERQNFQNEKQSLIRDYESERTRWDISSDAENEYSFKKERRKIENSFREEKEELGMTYRSQLTKLEEKVVILETEKAEMELKFLNEKAELEQKFRIERAELQQNATSSNREVNKSQKYIDNLKIELEKKHFDNVKEIERQFKKDKETMLDNMENEVQSLRKKHQKEMSDLRKSFSSQVEKDNKLLNESVRTLGLHERELEAALQEKEIKICHIEDEVEHYKKMLENMEEMYTKEFDSQKEKLNLQTTAFTTEKSRYLREIQELKDQLYRASASSDRDLALKEKVFNDAKAEVINLNKKLEEKSRKIRSFEDSLMIMEEKLNATKQDKDELDNQVKSLKMLLNENNMRARDEKKNMMSKSIRSDTLVTDLYLENANLMKQIADAESNLGNSNKQIRQLTDQKRALQRVISKLCHAHGITNFT
ncbi:ninein-like protein isoform X3 [Hydractinia symbiolongicarpus]|uniref:ninein-like protein isoform X3 n=1 Tax=Hydractinia symbiolongicarpus TaxID=13093 RepID=UPI002550D2D9|nr:ninein-like protein isoform X3 [Hydractinia symbiolongicarpus]